jgi:hypothetical protein
VFTAVLFATLNKIFLLFVLYSGKSRIVLVAVKGPCKNKFGDYGAGILPAGEAEATSIPWQWVCKERATKPAGKRPSQNYRSCFCTVPKIPIFAQRGRIFAFGAYAVSGPKTFPLIFKINVGMICIINERSAEP